MLHRHCRQDISESETSIGFAGERDNVGAQPKNQDSP